jgi:hypothetical protein
MNNEKRIVELICDHLAGGSFNADSALKSIEEKIKILETSLEDAEKARDCLMAMLGEFAR